MQEKKIVGQVFLLNNGNKYIALEEFLIEKEIFEDQEISIEEIHNPEIMNRI